MKKTKNLLENQQVALIILPMTALNHTDIPTNSWVSHLPTLIQPYALLMRLDRPIGTWLLFLPSCWGLAITGGSPVLYGLFALGAIIMRGAGCVINDLWDKDFDKKVERTKSRPLAGGAVTPKQAMVFLICLLGCGLFILLQLSPLAIALGVLSLIPVILYPLAKRVTWYPQAALGMTFNLGALMGAAAVANTLPTSAILLYAAGFFWTMGYDTIYAHQDSEDDKTVGIKSTALKFAEQSYTYITAFYALAALLTYIAGFALQLSFLFYIFWGCACLHFVWQIITWDMKNPKDCLKKFRSNRDFGLLIFAALLFGFWA